MLFLLLVLDLHLTAGASPPGRLLQATTALLPVIPDVDRILISTSVLPAAYASRSGSATSILTSQQEGILLLVRLPLGLGSAQPAGIHGRARIRHQRVNLTQFLRRPDIFGPGRPSSLVRGLDELETVLTAFPSTWKGCTGCRLKMSDARSYASSFSPHSAMWAPAVVTADAQRRSTRDLSFPIGQTCRFLCGAAALRTSFTYSTLLQSRPIWGALGRSAEPGLPRPDAAVGPVIPTSRNAAAAAADACVAATVAAGHETEVV